jgi:hypothetical protein
MQVEVIISLVPSPSCPTPHAYAQVFFLQLALKKMPLQKRKDKPIPLPLPHPLLSPEGADLCLFVKDHKGEGHKEAKAMVNRFERKGGVAKVVGLSKLRSKYESHEAKRELCKLYDLFLADERILPSLPKLIGKSFFKKKKQPIPVDITVKDFPAQVRVHVCPHSKKENTHTHTHIVHTHTHSTHTHTHSTHTHTHSTHKGTNILHTHI